MDKPEFHPKPRKVPIPFRRAASKQSPQVQGRLREKAIARDLGGRVQPASGAFPNHPGDVTTDSCLIESKFTKARSYTFSLEALHKLKREAELIQKIPVLVLEFAPPGARSYPERWIAMPYEDWKAICETHGALHE